VVWLRFPGLRNAALTLWNRGEPVPFPEGFPPGFPEDGYRGAYVAQTAADLTADGSLASMAAAAPDWGDDRRWQAIDPLPATARADNRLITIARAPTSWSASAPISTCSGIRFDSWFSERTLHGLEPGSRNAVEAVVRRLVAHDWAYEARTSRENRGRQRRGR